jgi:DNA-binding transcriptional MerR regulator
VTEKTEVLFDIGDEKLMTIGAVVDRLKGEFPDVSVSKLRYLEEQGLVTPRRTKGGYRLFSRDDYQRLIRVLALQRDEYLPLKVIRKEIERTPAGVVGPARGGLRKADFVVNPAGEKEFTAEEVQQLAAADSSLLVELEEFELIKGRQVSGVRRYTELEASVVATAARLARAGLRPKNLRAMKSAVDREGGLIEQVMLPSLRSHRTEQRQEALEALEELAQAMSQLQQLLLTRYIRRLTV